VTRSPMTGKLIFYGATGLLENDGDTATATRQPKQTDLAL